VTDLASLDPVDKDYKPYRKIICKNEEMQYELTQLVKDLEDFFDIYDWDLSEIDFNNNLTEAEKR